MILVFLLARSGLRRNSAWLRLAGLVGLRLRPLKMRKLGSFSQAFFKNPSSSFSSVKFPRMFSDESFLKASKLSNSFASRIKLCPMSMISTVKGKHLLIESRVKILLEARRISFKDQHSCRLGISCKAVCEQESFVRFVSLRSIVTGSWSSAAL